MKTLHIIRGPSGSGKTTIARFMTGNEYHEADKFFVDPRKQWQWGYKFDASKLSVAHKWCQSRVERDLFHGIEDVVVSNTSTTSWELAAYLELANQYNYDVKIIRAPRPWIAETLFERNVHNVPLDVIKKQINRYEKHPLETEWSDMDIFQ